MKPKKDDLKNMIDLLFKKLSKEKELNESMLEALKESKKFLVYPTAFPREDLLHTFYMIDMVIKKAEEVDK